MSLRGEWQEERKGKGDGSMEKERRVQVTRKDRGKRNTSLWQANQEVMMEHSEHAGWEMPLLPKVSETTEIHA